MIKSMNKQHMVIASVVAAVLVVGGVTAMLSSSGKKSAMSYYDNLKERFFLGDVLSEGDISYSVLSGNLTVAHPEIRLASTQTNGAEQFLRGLSGLFEAARGKSTEEGLAAWAKYHIVSTTGRDAGGVYAKADALKVAHSGDSKDGEIHLQLLGLDMSNPFISRKGADVVLVSDVTDEIQPREEIGQYGEVVKSSYSWSNNMAAHAPVTGAFLIGATGDFGTKVDLDFTIKRSSDGEGAMKFVVLHRNDGSEVGRIVREAKFTSLPELDTIEEQLKAALSSFIIAAYSTYTGQSVLADTVSNFARKAKVSSYSLTYKGFRPVKDSFGEYKVAAKQTSFAAFCQAVGLSNFQSDFGSKAKGHSDSECAIAEKLAEDGKFEESYTFKDDKSLFADIIVSKGYDLETN